MAATLHGVGLGPGDPELITLKGWRIISMAPVIAYPRGQSGQARARQIAAPFIPDDVLELALDIPFTGEAAALEAAYGKAAEVIAGHLQAGRDVAFLCLGDPLLYGSFGKLAARLNGRFEVRAVPGVNAAQAAAARLGAALAQGSQPLKLLPATMDDDALLAECFNRHATLAILKAGHHLRRVHGILQQAGRAEGAVVVQELGNGAERIMPLAEAASAEDANYFSLVLAWPQGA